MEGGTEQVSTPESGGAHTEQAQHQHCAGTRCSTLKTFTPAIVKTDTGSLLHPMTGSALRFAVQTAILPASGGRDGVPKAVVMLVTDKSSDDVTEAVNEAMAAGEGVTQ